MSERLIFQEICILQRCRRLGRSIYGDFSVDPTPLHVVDSGDGFCLLIKLECVTHDYKSNGVEVLHLNIENTVDARQERLRVFLEVAIQVR